MKPRSCSNATKSWRSGYDAARGVAPAPAAQCFCQTCQHARSDGAAVAEIEMAKNSRAKCAWLEIDECLWRTSCYGLFVIEGGLLENNYFCCPVCGREIEEIPRSAKYAPHS